MSSEIQRAIAHYYPARALVSPGQDPSVIWDYDVANTTLRAIVAELEALEPTTRPGTRGARDVSEELLVGPLHLQLSHLGPFAALNYGSGTALDVEIDRGVLKTVADIAAILERHRIRLLRNEELEEPAPWIERTSATIWDCLFQGPP